MIGKIVLNPDRIPDCYEILGRENKNELIRQQIHFYESYQGKAEALTNFCASQIVLLNQGRKTEYSLEDAKKLVPLCLFVLQNRAGDCQLVDAEGENLTIGVMERSADLRVIRLDFLYE